MPLAIGLLLPPFLSASHIRLATEILIFGLFAASLNLLVGYGGLISFGHATFFAIGAYVPSILLVRLGIGMPFAFVAAPFGATLVAAIIGALSVRLGHSYFVMLTLAFGQLVHSVLVKWRPVTGGDDGLLGVYPLPALREPWAYYYFVLGTVLLSLVLLFVVTESPFGYSLRGVRDNPQRAASIGVNLYVHRLLAFEVAAFFGGVAGALWVFYQRSVFPDLAYWLVSADALVMVALGGTGTFGGPIIGAAIFQILNRTIPTYTEYWQFFLGVLILALVIAAPRGVTALAAGAWWLRMRGNRGPL